MVHIVHHGSYRGPLARAACHGSVRGTRALVPLLGSLLWLIGCGGGDPDSGAPAARDDTVDVAVSAPPPDPSLPLRGTLTIVERDDKRVIDAWFVDATTSSAPIDVAVEGSCASGDGALETDGVPGPAIATRAALGPIELLSRGSVYARLEGQRLGALQVHASTERWYTRALPDDVTLSFPGDARFDDLVLPALASLPPLILLQPATSVLERPDGTIRWAADDHPSSRLRLRVTARDPITNARVDLECIARDDGEFTLPPEAQALLADASAPLALFARRERVTVGGGARATLRVVQSAYPRT